MIVVVKPGEVDLNPTILQEFAMRAVFRHWKSQSCPSGDERRRTDCMQKRTCGKQEKSNTRSYLTCIVARAPELQLYARDAIAETKVLEGLTSVFLASTNGCDVKSSPIAESGSTGLECTHECDTFSFMLLMAGFSATPKARTRLAQRFRCEFDDTRNGCC